MKVIYYNNVINLAKQGHYTQCDSSCSYAIYLENGCSHRKHDSLYLRPCVCHNIWYLCDVVPMCTHPARELCSVEAHNSQWSGSPLDYWEWSAPPSPVAHRFSLRWQRTGMGRRHSHANHLHHLQHLMEKGGIIFLFRCCLVFTHLQMNAHTVVWGDDTYQGLQKTENCMLIQRMKTTIKTNNFSLNLENNWEIY